MAASVSYNPLAAPSPTMGGGKRRKSTRYRRRRLSTSVDPLVSVARKQLAPLKNARREWEFYFHKALDVLTAQNVDNIETAALIADAAVAARTKRHQV